jgi:uncharacterized protein (TIGR00661 family)
MSNQNSIHVLICVLDWGLGHATRCIPVINSFRGQQAKVSIAGNGFSLELLKKEFPELIFHQLPSYSVKYGSSGFFFSKLAVQVPKILNAIRKEKKEMARLVKSINPDIIVSDNRYGCYAANVYSVFITHQLNIQLPWPLRIASSIVNYFYDKLLERFNEIWVPDFSNHALSGLLSESTRHNLRFVGSLSRFSFSNNNAEEKLIVGLVSGPEPQRTIFENILKQQFKLLDNESMIVQGLPQLAYQSVKQGNLTLITHLPSSELSELIARADIIVARSGYSTVMDLYTLKKKRVIFIPTPGQTEQEYLAKELNRKRIALSQTQQTLNVQHALESLNNYTGFINEYDDVTLLKISVENLLSMINKK